MGMVQDLPSSPPVDLSRKEGPTREDEDMHIDIQIDGNVVYVGEQFHGKLGVFLVMTTTT